MSATPQNLSNYALYGIITSKLHKEIFVKINKGNFKNCLLNLQYSNFQIVAITNSFRNT